MKAAITLISSLLLTLVAFGEVPIVEPTKTLPYKTTESGDLSLHAFLPKGHQASDTRPAIVFFFGGGWNGGTPKQFYGQAKALADLGIVAFSAEYRTKKSHGTTPFECVKDAKSAVRWVREHAKELGVDPERIVASGGSAGGHLAACTGVIEGYEEGNGEISSRPNAMALFNPVLDTTEKGYGASRFTADQQTALSPCHHITAGVPPTIIFQGTADTTTPHENAERFLAQMKEAGNTCILKSYEGKKHGFFNGKVFRPNIKDESAYQSTLKELITFLEELKYLPVGETE